MNPGDSVAIKTSSGKASESKYKRGTFVQYSGDGALIEFPANPKTGMALERKVVSLDKLVKIH